MNSLKKIYFVDKVPSFTAFFVSLICIISLDYITNNGNLVSLFLLITFIIFTFFYRFSLGVTFFIVVFIFSDIFSTENLYSNSGMSSLHSLYLGPLSIGVWLLLFLLTTVFYYNLFAQKNTIYTINKRLYPFLVLIVSGVTLGLLNSNLDRIFIKHIAPYIVFLIVLYIIVHIYNNVEKKRNLLNTLLLLFFAKSIVIYFKYLFGLGSDVAYLLVVSYDPIGSFPILLLCLSITSFFFIRKHVIYNLLNIFLALSIIIYSSGRSSMLFLILFLATFIFCLISVKTNGRFKIASKFIPLVIVFLVTPVILYFIRGSFLNYALWRYLKTFTEFSAFDSSVRAATIVNTYFDHISNNTLIFGKGFGGYILDNWVPFEFVSRDITKAFSNSSIMSGKFHSMHEQVFDIFLQNGLLGVLIIIFITISFTKLFIKCFRSCSSYYQILSLAFIFPLLNLLFVGFTIKSFFVASILFLFILQKDILFTYEKR